MPRLPLAAIELPPGIYANGTPLEAKGRWRDGNLIRWYNGHLRPIGGWQRFTSVPLTGIPRALQTWRDNTAVARLAIGTPSHLYLHDGSLAYDISPVDLVPGRDDGNTGLGYGANNYSDDTYGTPRSSSGLTLDATVWDLDNFGAELVAFSPADGRIFIWNPPNTGAPAVEIGRMGAVSMGAITTATTGGSIAAGTYYYKVTALGVRGETMGSAEVHIATTGSSSTVTVNFFTLPGAQSYEIYRGTTAGGENQKQNVAAPAPGIQTQFFTDTGSGWVSGTVPTVDTSSNAPEHNYGVIVTDERFVVALGANGDPRNITWCSQEDPTQWVATATNTAGSLQLKTNGIVKNARRLPGETIIFTDTDVHAMQFIGTPFVYGINRIGTNCGIIGRKAHAGTQNFCVWMGNLGFYIYDGVVRQLDCDIQEYIFDNLNRQQASKIVAGVNSQYNECWFMYPSAGSTENDTIAIWNYKEQWWSYTKLERTAWADREVWPYPIAAESSGTLFEHENGWTDSGMPRYPNVYAISGIVDISVGDRFVDVNQLIPDLDSAGMANLQFQFDTAPTPNGPHWNAGPYSAGTRNDGYIDVRLNGRQIQMQVTPTEDSLFQMGILRFDPGQGGKR